MAVKLFDSPETAYQQVPVGRIKKLIIRGEAYAIAHNETGLHVVENLCPHQREGLNRGSLNAFNEIICPLHQYRFDLHTGQEADNRCNHLKVIPVQIKPAGVFVDL
jgi:3-phenylpropionate/trans-cinnamate dioxygenase ferredoxin subunit